MRRPPRGRGLDRTSWPLPGSRPRRGESGDDAVAGKNGCDAAARAFTTALLQGTADQCGCTAGCWRCVGGRPDAGRPCASAFPMPMAASRPRRELGMSGADRSSWIPLRGSRSAQCGRSGAMSSQFQPRRSARARLAQAAAAHFGVWRFKFPGPTGGRGLRCILHGLIRGTASGRHGSLARAPRQGTAASLLR